MPALEVPQLYTTGVVHVAVPVEPVEPVEPVLPFAGPHSSHFLKASQVGAFASQVTRVPTVQAPTGSYDWQIETHRLKSNLTPAMAYSPPHTAEMLLHAFSHVAEHAVSQESDPTTTNEMSSFITSVPHRAPGLVLLP
ncbi:MAG: hypothetical protein IT381_31110 [Deltaproteobacteria bacterium]|nr:hypothetical protein [Deltaproteobacteria bacterium]